MSTPRLVDLLARMAPVVREEMLRVAVPNCCVATVAVLRRVFRHFHFETSPLAVTVTIRNAKMIEALTLGTPIPSDPEALGAWMQKTGAWAIGICPESAQLAARQGYDAFGGHLVTRVQDVIVDASLDQANRPQYKILIPPFMAVVISPKFLSGGHALAGTVNGCEIIYTRLTDSSWRTSPDWTNERTYRDTVNRIIERVRP
jgi:hypothetical protein